MGRLLIKGGDIVTPTNMERGYDLLIENGKIADIGSSLDAGDARIIHASDCIVLPGIIDLHTDALEAEITPRPGANFPLDVALQEIDSKMLCCGITTVYHSLHLGYDAATLRSQSKYSREEVFAATHQFARRSALANFRIHLRFEVLGVHTVDTLENLISEGTIDLLSFMDHTPGQGQYQRDQFIKSSLRNGGSEEGALAELERRQAIPKIRREKLAEIAALAREQAIPVASHDDDNARKVKENHEMGLSICEFPINEEAAREGRKLGMSILGGASNVLRGGSLSGNLCMLKAVEEGLIDGLCSDYYPPSILHAVFKLWREKLLTLPDAVNLASLNPARAANIASRTGSLEIGKDADAIIVSLHDRRPRVTHCIVNGKIVYQLGETGKRSQAEEEPKQAQELASSR